MILTEVYFVVLFTFAEASVFERSFFRYLVQLKGHINA